MNILNLIIEFATFIESLNNYYFKIKLTLKYRNKLRLLFK